MSACSGDGLCDGHGHCEDGVCVCTAAGWYGTTCNESSQDMLVYTALGGAAYAIFLLCAIYYAYRLAKAHKRRLHWTPLRCSPRAAAKPSNILAALILVVQCIQLLAFAFQRDVPWPAALTAGTRGTLSLTLFDVAGGYWAFRSLFWVSAVWAMLFVVVLGPYLLTCTCCCGGRWARAAVYREALAREEYRRTRTQCHQSSASYRHSRSAVMPAGSAVPPDGSDDSEREVSQSQSHSRMGSALHRGNADTGQRRLTVAEVMIERDWCLGVLMTASPAVVHVTGLVWIPAVRVLLETFHCTFDAADGRPPYVTLDPTMACYSGTHVRYASVAAATLGVFLPLSFRILPLTKTEFNPSLDLKLKQTFNVRLLACQLLLCAVSTYGSAWVTAPLVCVALVSVYLSVVAWRLPPTRFKAVNDFMRVTYAMALALSALALVNEWHGVESVVPTAVVLALIAALLLGFVVRQSVICCCRGRCVACRTSRYCCRCCAAVAVGEDTRLTEDSAAHGDPAFDARSDAAGGGGGDDDDQPPEPNSDDDAAVMPAGAIDLDADPSDANAVDGDEEQISQIFRSYDVDGNEIARAAAAPVTPARRQAALPPVMRSGSAATPIATSRAANAAGRAASFTPFTHSPSGHASASLRHGVMTPPDRTNQIAPVSAKWAQALMDIENSAAAAPAPYYSPFAGDFQPTSQAPAAPTVTPQYSSDGALPPLVRSQYQTFN